MKKKQVTYSVEEFTSSPEVLEASADLIRAAFTFAGVEETTKSKAKKIINDFKNREVQ